VIKYLTFTLILSIFIISSWFPEGKIFGTAEEGIIFYNTSITSKVYSTVWQEDMLGYPLSTLAPQAPFFKFASLTNNFLDTRSFQMATFIFLFSSGMYGAYLLAAKFRLSNVEKHIASLFYFFNLYTMTQVLARSLIVGIFAWAYLPIFLYLYVKSLNKNTSWILFLLSGFIYSFAYSMPSNLAVMWFPASLYSLYRFVHEKDKRTRIALRTVMIMATWILINYWWLHPYIAIIHDTFSYLSWEKSFESLESISGQFPLDQILQLRQNFYFYTKSNPHPPWGTFYESFLSRFLSLSVLTLTMIGIKHYKSKQKYYWLALLLTALFVAKGTNPPLGHWFYKVAFQKTFFAQAFRNSYEKFGSVLLLGYSVFFGVGVAKILGRISSTLKKSILLVIILVSSMYYLVLPIWRGTVHPSYSWVRVPDSYEKLNKYLKTVKDESRLLVVPMLPSHGVQFAWGYHGDDSTRLLIDKPSISRQLKLKYSSEKYNSLKEKFLNKSLSKNDLEELDIQFVLLNNDIKFKESGAENPSSYLQVLEEKNLIKTSNRFDNLILYELDLDANIVEIEGLDSYIYKKINSQKYTLSIVDAKAPYNLILKNSFNPTWIVRTGDESLGTHYMWKDYANAWHINKTGSYNIEILFKIWPWE